MTAFREKLVQVSLCPPQIPNRLVGLALNPRFPVLNTGYCHVALGATC